MKGPTAVWRVTSRMAASWYEGVMSRTTPSRPPAPTPYARSFVVLVFSSSMTMQTTETCTSIDLASVGFGAVGAGDGESAVESARTLRPAGDRHGHVAPGNDRLRGHATPQGRRGHLGDPRLRAHGSHRRRHREQAERAGCDLFIVKPCSPVDLAEHIRRALDGSCGAAVGRR